MIARFVATAIRRRADLWPLARAAWLLPWTTMRLRRIGGRAVAASFSQPAANEARALSPESVARARRLQRVVEIASVHGFAEGTCLSRSLTLLELLRRESIPGTLRVGVRAPGSAFEAHAWVQCGDVVLNDRADVDTRYAAFGA